VIHATASCYDRKSSAVSAATSSVVVEFASGDGVTSSGYTSGRGGDVDDVIFVEGPREEGKDRLELPAVEVYSSVSNMLSTSPSRQFQVASTAIGNQPWIKPRTPGDGSREMTSSQPTSTTVVSSDSELPAEVKSDDEEVQQHRSAPRYLALAVNVALLAGIIFVVAVFLAVLVSLVVHRRRQRRRQDVTSAPTSNVATAVSRPRIKPAYDDFSTTYKHAAICLPDNKPRLFVSVSKVGDPKEWFV